VRNGASNGTLPDRVWLTKRATNLFESIVSFLRQINAFCTFYAKTSEMLPAPHTNFLENSMIDSDLRHNDLRRFALTTTALVPQMSSRPKKLFGPVATFLASRVGCRWSRILLELEDRLGTHPDFRRLLPQLANFVEIHVAEQNGVLCHGSGLLRGQPLRTGWRKKLYVCPDTGRLRKIGELHSTAGVS